MKIPYSQLPSAIQTIFAEYLDHDQHSLNALNVYTNTANGYKDLFVAPELMYDFNESNYTLHTINLTKVLRLNVGPGAARMFEKTDPNTSVGNRWATRNRLCRRFGAA